MKQISDMMSRGLKEGIFPGAVLLASVGNDIRYFKEFGVSDFFSHEPVKKNSIFDLASLTKPFATAFAVLILVEQKKLFLEQSLSTILSGNFLGDKSDITIGQLLHHTSGLPAHKEYFIDLMNYKKESRRQKLREFIAKEPFIGKPGENQVYSDLGFIILAWVVEAVSKERIDRFIYEQLYRKLEIDDLFYIDNFEPHLLQKELYERTIPTEECKWRKKLLRAEVHDDNAWAVGGIEGHAGLFGDAMSLWKLSVEVMNALNGIKTKVFDCNFFQKNIVKSKNSNFAAGFDTPSKYASSSGRYFSEQSIGHLGYTGTSFWIDPEKSIIIIMLSNRVHPDRNNEKIKKFRPKIYNLIMEQIL